MNRLGIFIDVSNLYYCVFHKHQGKLDYSKLLEFIAPIGDIIIANAYGAQIKDEAQAFIEILKTLGFEPKYKEPKFYGAHKGKADWDVGIAVDIIESLENIDTVVLCSADGDMLPVIKYIKKFNKEVVIIGAGISSELQNYARCIEIPESMIIRSRRREQKDDTIKTD